MNIQELIDYLLILKEKEGNLPIFIQRNDYVAYNGYLTKEDISIEKDSEKYILLK